MVGVNAITLKRLRETYPGGTRIELQSLDVPYSKLKRGDKGTVSFVDDTGTIHMHWDRGSSLGLIEGIDEFNIIPVAKAV